MNKQHFYVRPTSVRKSTYQIRHFSSSLATLWWLPLFSAVVDVCNKSFQKHKQIHQATKSFRIIMYEYHVRPTYIGQFVNLLLIYLYNKHPNRFDFPTSLRFLILLHHHRRSSFSSSSSWNNLMFFEYYISRLQFAILYLHPNPYIISYLNE